MKLDTPSKLSPMTIGLHWIVGVTMIGLLIIGIYMVNTGAYALYSVHKSLGILAFLVIIARVIWRLKNGWPVALGKSGRLARGLAQTVHWALLVSTLLLPISGMLMSGVGGYGLDIFGLSLLAPNINPDNPGVMVSYHEGIASLSSTMHSVIGNVLLILLILHIAGAVKHHIVDKDGTLTRMLGKRV